MNDMESSLFFFCYLTMICQENSDHTFLSEYATWRTGKKRTLCKKNAKKKTFIQYISLVEQENV